MNYFRPVLRRTITTLVRNLPVNTRRAMMEALAAGPDCYDLFQAIGLKHGVRDISVSGEYGVIEGSLADEKIIASYAKSRNWTNGKFNRLLVDFFSDKGGTYIDIGANLGLTTIPIAANPAVACMAFEPEPDNYRHLQHNVAAHCPHGNVRLFEVALYDCNGTIDFEIDVHNSGDHRIHVIGEGLLMEASRPVIPVRSARLDDVFDVDRLSRPIVVKMDTQGSEGQIFAGGTNLLAASAMVFLEYWPYSMKRFNADLDALTGYIGRTFPTGAIVPGDNDVSPDWQPISGVIKMMEERWRLVDAEPFVYYEIYLKT